MDIKITPVEVEALAELIHYASAYDDYRQTQEDSDRQDEVVEIWTNLLQQFSETLERLKEQTP